jgi:hypothetical protein
VGHFSIVKRVTFPLSRCDTTCQGGSLLGCHVGHFLLDVHMGIFGLDTAFCRNALVVQCENQVT